MKKLSQFFFFLTLLTVQFSTAQKLNITDYPTVQPTTSVQLFDWKKIDSLKENGLVREAIQQIKVLQEKAIKTKNIQEFWNTLKELEPLYFEAQFENDEAQQFVWEFSQKAEKLPFPLNNLMHLQAVNWINGAFYQGKITFDDESLNWTINGKPTKLQNNNIDELIRYHKIASLNQPMELMKISAQLISSLESDVEVVKNSMSAFELITNQLIQSPRNFNNQKDYDDRLITDSTYFGMTDDLVKAQDFNDSSAIYFQLYYHIEQLCLKNNRLDNYGFWVERRLHAVYQKATFEKVNQFDRDELLLKAFQKLEIFLKDSPASARFTYHIASHLVQEAHDKYDWKISNGIRNNCSIALQKIENSLKTFPNSEFAVKLTELKKYIFSEDVSFTLKGNVTKGKNSLLNVSYRNSTSAFIKVYKIEEEKKEKNDANPLKNLVVSSVYLQQLTFEKDTLHLKHNKDFILPTINSAGKYLFLMARSEKEMNELFAVDSLSKKDKFQYKIIQVSSLEVVTKTDDGKATFLVMNSTTGAPLKNVKIKITKMKSNYSNDNSELDTILKTSQNGTAEINLQGSFEVKINDNGDEFVNQIYVYKLIESTQRYFKTYTDRAIYRPGQKVDFKIIALEEVPKKETILLKEMPVEIEIKDQNGKLIWKNKLISNQFGSVSSSFVLPQNGFLLGNLFFTINGGHQHYFKVEEYKRPTFDIVFDTVKGKVKLGDSLTISGKVNAFAGYPISNATVSINISQQNYFPHWCDVHYEESHQTQQINAVTNESGTFKFTFLPTRSKYLFGSHFSFNATVIDISGETHEASTSLFIGEQSYSIAMTLPENMLSTKGNKVQVNVQNNQGVQQKGVNVSYTLTKQTSKKWFASTIERAEYQAFSTDEFERNFPLISYGTNPNNEVKETIAEGKLKSGESLDINQLLKNKPGHYILSAETIDETGEKSIVTNKFNFIVPTSKTEQHQSEFWVVSTAKNSKIGDEVDFNIGSSHKSMNVFVEYDNRKNETNYKWVTVRGRKTIHFKITEKEKDGFILNFIAVKNGKLFNESIFVPVQNHEKEVGIKLQTMRDFIQPGSKENWTISVTDSSHQSPKAELLVGMYDASLDALTPHFWDYIYRRKVYLSSNWRENYSNNLLNETGSWNANFAFDDPFYSQSRGYGNNVYFDDGIKMLAMEQRLEGIKEVSVVLNKKDLNNSDKEELELPQKSIIQPRTNFNETAFFYPTVYADSSHNYRFEFTLPDALTTWRFMAFAHTKDLKTGYFEQSFEAKKELMIEPNEPRFFREGDMFLFSSKVTNTTANDEDVTVRLKLIDPITEKDVTSSFGSLTEKKVTLVKNSTMEISWELTIPVGQFSEVAYLVELEGSKFLDAEKKIIPILSNRQLISVAKPFVKTTAGEQTFSLEKINQLSKTADKISLKLEMQTQPLWTTLMSLPYLMEFPYECAEQTFARYFGNVVAQKIIADNPAFKRVIDSWKMQDPNAFLSELAKNPELKSIVLNETPWLMDAQNEAQQRQNLAILFDKNTLSNSIQSTINKLKDMKAPDGGWSWFGAEKSNIYITQHIVSGFGQLKRLGIQFDEEIVESAVIFLENYYRTEFEKLKKEEKEKGAGLTDLHVHWLISRSYFNEPTSPISSYYQNGLMKQWKQFNLHTQALAGMSFVQSGNKEFAVKIKNSIVDRATKRPEMGMYWNENKNGYFWNQAPIETQSSLIEFFTLLGGLDKEVEQMQLWLLQQKRTNAWESTKATTMACYALLVNKATIQNQLSQVVSVRLGDGTNLGTLPTNSGSQFSWSGSEITAGKATVKVETANNQPVFGAIYLSYLDELQTIQKSSGDIRLERHFYFTNNGKEEEILATTHLPIGTKVTVKLIITSNRPMEFVHLKDSKASGIEARETLSGYHYSTVGYYQISKDASTEFFIDYLPKGSHVISYDEFVSAKGELSVGAAIVECMYAPTFRANSDGWKFRVE